MSIDSLALVRAAIDDVNNQQADGPVIDLAEDTMLFDPVSGIDSLMLVNLFVALEQQIEDATGKIVVVVDENSMANTSHPFRTVGSLAQYIEKFVD